MVFWEYTEDLHSSCRFANADLAFRNRVLMHAFFCTSLETDDAQVSELVDVLESIIIDHDRLLCQIAVY